MSDNLMNRDNQVGVAMGWHGKTEVVETITKEKAFPWNVVLATAGYKLDGANEWLNHGKWVVPLANDDLLPLGNGTPVNLETYSIRTPQDTWDFVQGVLNGTDSQVVSAGTVLNRARFFISTKLVELEKVKLTDGSDMELLLNGMGSLDKSMNEQISLSGTRIVCYNTLMLSFLTDAIKWRYRHSKNMGQKIINDKPLIEKVAGFSAIVKATFDGMINTPCTKDRAANVYAGYLTDETTDKLSTRTQNMVEEHVAAFATGDGNAGKSEFDLLNGFTQLRTRGYSESSKDGWDKFVTSEFGAYANSKSDFAGLLTNPKRRAKELPEVEARGHKLLNLVTAS